MLIRDERPFSSIDVFDKCATLLKTIPLPSHVIEPRQVVTTHTGSLVVSFGQTSSQPHGVCKVTETGQFSHSFVADKEWQRLRSPNYLAIDHKGAVFISDQWNQRIIKLDDQLRFELVVLPDEGSRFQGLFHLNYVAETNQLIIAHGCISVNANVEGNKADIFNVNE